VIVLAVLVNSSPVIGIIFSDVVVIDPKLADKGNPVISKKLARPTTIPSLLSSTLASKVGVLIVIDPSANTAKVLTVVVSSSPVAITLAKAITFSSP